MIHLHNHTTVDSIRDAYSKVPELVARVKELGMDAVAVTGHGSMSSSIHFFEEAQKQGIKGIIGLEAYFCSDVTIRDRKETYHLVLLAKNAKGYLNLIKLNTEAHRNFYYKPRIDVDILRKYSEGLICLSGCMGSILNTPQAEHWIQQYNSIFNDDFYLEIQSNTMPEQRDYNEKLIGYSKKFGIPLVLTCDTHYVFQEQAKWHRLWVTQGKDSEYYTCEDFYVQTEDDVRAICSYLPQDVLDNAIEATHIIAGKVSFDKLPHGNMMPKYKSENALEELKQQCRDGWRAKVSGRVPAEKINEYNTRVIYELDVMDKGGYVDYMLIISDILRWCRENHIMHGFGRGSCGGSIVSWLLNISACNPIAHSLLFERFLNPSRVTQADIDIDLQHDKRDLVIAMLAQKYKHVLQIRTIGYVKDKSAVQYAGRILRYPPTVIDGISKNIEKLSDIEDTEKYADLIELATNLIGLCDKFGSHASGYVVTDEDPTDYVSIEKQGETFVLNQEYHTLEHLGFLKLDLLSLSNLTIIQNTIDNIDAEINLWNMPMDDPEVYDLYATHQLSTVFQVESSMMGQYAKRLKVACFDDIVALLSIGRPAVIQSGMADQYIECKDTGEYSYIHPLLEPILSKTHSSLIFQEQVMAIVQSVAGMSLAEADNMRRIMGRKIDDEGELRKIIDPFLVGCENNGIDKDVALEIAKWLMGASSYLFNKSHAACYSYLSYITAMLKHRFPRQYMCAVLNNEIGDIEKTTEYFKELKRMGITVKPPDIYKSKTRHTVVGNDIYFGFNALKGVGDITVNADFTTFPEFLIANPQLNKRVLEALVKAGAFDSINANRGELLYSLDGIRELQKTIEKCKDKIKENSDALAMAVDPKGIKKYRRQLEQWQTKLSEATAKEVQRASGDYDAIAEECSVLGFSFQEIPLVKPGVITRIFTKKDKNGNEMAWLDFDSPYSKFKGTCFSKGWTLIKDIVSVGQSVKFVVDKDILQEISVDGKVYQTNVKKQWKS